MSCHPLPEVPKGLSRVHRESFQDIPGNPPRRQPKFVGVAAEHIRDFPEEFITWVFAGVFYFRDMRTPNANLLSKRQLSHSL